MNLIFDFDGTICDSFDIVLENVNKYLVKYKGKRVTKDEIKTKGIEQLIKEYKTSKLQVLIYVYKSRQEFGKRLTDATVFPGLSLVLIELARKNRLGIVSSNSKENIEKILKEAKILDLFSFIKTESSLFNKAKRIKKVMRQYKLEANETIYIGDEIRDIKAGKAANLKTAGVIWGYEGEDLLKKASPDFIIRDAKELLLLER